MENSSNNNQVFIGLDYSMTSPGLCVLSSNTIALFAFYNQYHGPNGKEFDLPDGRKLTINILKNVESYSSPIDRFDTLARKMLATINMHELGTNTVVYIEGYSMASRGQVFHIAENTAILKHYLYRCDILPTEVAPMTVKKFGSGSGKAQKEDMHDAFMKETGLDLRSILTPTRKLGSPVTDVVDAYFIAKYAKENDKGSQKNKNERRQDRTD